MASSSPAVSLGYSAPTIMIPFAAYQAITITFCGVAIIGAAIRTYIRVSKGQQRVLDDYILLPFACATLIASTVLLNIGAPPLYQLVAAEYIESIDPSLAADISMEEIIAAIDKIQRFTYPYGALIWASIFAIKFCYLYFFRLLIDRQHTMVVYWRVAMVVTGLAAVFDICASFISCPKFGQYALQCDESYYVNRTLAVEIVTICLDIITDLMILAIPPYLMSKITLRTRQKLGIASFLCLSIFMIIIAIVRISRAHASDFEIWASFWQQFEGCIAVVMLSLTAFRTVFVQKIQSSSDPQKPTQSYLRKRLFGSKKSADSAGEPKVDVQVPGATMTGMRTFIRGSGSPHISAPVEYGNSLDFEKGDPEKAERVSAEHFV